MPPPPIQPLMVLDSLKVAKGALMVALAWIQLPAFNVKQPMVKARAGKPDAARKCRNPIRFRTTDAHLTPIFDGGPSRIGLARRIVVGKHGPLEPSARWQ